LSADDVLALAASLGGTTDPLLRQELARLVTYQRVAGWTTERLLATGGQRVAPALSKLASTRVVKGAAQAALALIGTDALLAAPDGPEHGYYAHVLQFSAASSIYGGSDEIQRNILAERVLELPRDRR
jgi:alkylation response protein AidB-like acyl-CoA dehydrogenase